MRPRAEHALPLFVGAITLLAYALTLSFGLSGGDAGELTLAAHRLAVAHPPGYPTFVLLGHLASWIPVGSGATRLNLFSALCGAGAAALLSAAVLRLTRSPAAALCGAGLFAFAPLSWTWSTRTDVFALANLLAAALVWAAARHEQAPSLRTLGAGALLGGLALTNHHTAVLLVAPLAVWALWRIRSEPWRRRAWLTAGGCALLGLVPYLALPLLAQRAPSHSWGEAASLHGFWQLVTRADYGSLQLAAQTTSAHLPRALTLFAGDALRTTLAVGLVGVWFALRTRRALPAALGIAFLLSGPGFLALARFPLPDALHEQTLERFFLLPSLVLCALVGLGLPRALRSLTPRWSLGTALGAVILQGAVSGSSLQRPPESLAEAWARGVLQPLPERSAVLMRGDLLSNALRWVHEGEGLRPDVTLLDLELLTRPWHVRTRGSAIRLPNARYFPGAADGFTLAQLVAANPDRAFFVVGELKPGDPTQALFRLRPEGLAQRLLPANAAGAALPFQPPAALAQAARQTWADAWDAAIVAESWEAQHRVPLEALRTAINTQAGAQVYAEIAQDLDQLVTAHPDPPAAWLKNLGIAHGRAGALPRMREAFRRYLDKAPDAPDRALIAEQLR